MSRSLKETNKFRTEILWEVSKEELEELKSKDEAEEDFELTERFADGTWELSLSSDAREKRSLAFLEGIPQLEDYQRSSSTIAWSRKSEVYFSFKLVEQGEHANEPAVGPRLDFRCDSNHPNTGIEVGGDARKLLEFCELEPERFALHAIIESSFSVSPSPPTNPLFAFFDNKDYADTLFLIHNIEENAPTPILACKAMLVSASSHFETLFQSGFSEATTKKLLDVEDISEFTSDTDFSPYKAAQYEAVPFRPLDEKIEDRYFEELPPWIVAATEKVIAKSKKGKKRARDDDEDDEYDPGPDGKRLTVIEIHETSYNTFRAMIAYLHSRLVPFTPLTSDYLVACHQARLEDSTETRWVLKVSMWDWLERQWNGLERARDWEGVQPCTPQSMYRLADRYEMDELREMTLGYIIRSLTVENVAYELFSPLSLDYELVQKPILDFFIKNWEEVKKSTSFKTVLDKFSLGELAKGRDLMETIFGLMRA